jgi:hypothetical protein
VLVDGSKRDIPLMLKLTWFIHGSALVIRIHVSIAQIGAKIDKITEKRHFPMYFCDTFNYSISAIYQQITIIKMEYIEKNWPKISIPPLSWEAMGQNLHRGQVVVGSISSSRGWSPPGIFVGSKGHSMGPCSQ